MLRKLLLTSFVIFVDIEHGSSKLLRLYLAAVVEAVFLLVLCLAHPFRRQDNLYLACTANLFLMLSFLSGIVIKLCDYSSNDADDAESSCQRFVGLDSQYQAALLVVLVSILMLVAALVLIGWQAASVLTQPTIRLRSNGEEPRLKLPRGCRFHAFVSHAWGTGQDQTHALVRQLQLLVPTMQLWLDVEQLQDMGNLEGSVRESATFVVFLSKGFFSSKNCRRGERPRIENVTFTSHSRPRRAASALY